MLLLDEPAAQPGFLGIPTAACVVTAGQVSLFDGAASSSPPIAGRALLARFERLLL